MSVGPSTPKLVSSLLKVTEDKLHVSKPIHWLTSRFHFSFAGWWRDAPPGFGALRVMNDDLVLPENGFTLHPHKHMEIFSYVLEGYLSHGDSEANSETLSRGAVQFMSAGDGVFHEEMNNDRNHTCRFIQTWIVPDREQYQDREVRYGSISLTRKDRLNRLRHVIGPLKPDRKIKKTTSEEESSSTTTTTTTTTTDESKRSEESMATAAEKPEIEFRRDVNVYVCEMDAPKKSVSYELKAGRQAYLLCMEGSMDVLAAKISDDDSSTTADEDKQSVSLMNRESVCLFGPLSLELIATGDGKDGKAMRYPDGSDGKDRSSLGVGFVNGHRIKMDAEDSLGIDVYPCAHLMLIEMIKAGPYRAELS